MKRFAIHLVTPIMLSAIFSAPIASASDGELEINQICATASGCFSGDAPGFPVTIDGSAGSSFRLTGDLQLSDATTHAIEILSTAENVTIDLGGFTIRGIVTCSGNGSSTSCRPQGTGNAIRAQVSTVRTSVSNGYVIGMGGAGLSLGAQSRVHGIQSSNNAYAGLQVGSNSLVTETSATENGTDGIVLSGASVVRDSRAQNNGSDGFVLNQSSLLARSTAFGNGDHGISGPNSASVQDATSSWNGGRGITLGLHSRISGSVARNNASHGIRAGDGCVVTGNNVQNSGEVGIDAGDACVISDNSVMNADEDGIQAGVGSTIRHNSVIENGTFTSHDGIHCSLGCRVIGNTARSNSGYGLRFNSTSSGYSDNTIGANAVGDVVLGRDAGGNVCGTALGC